MLHLRMALMIGLGLAIAASAKEQGKDNQATKGNQGRQARSGVAVTVDVFLHSDREILRSYVASHPNGDLPPGLARRRDLPPGLAKQLRKKGILPPGLQKRLTVFPSDLDSRLSVLREGLKRGFIEGRAVIYDSKTSVILDVFVPL